MLADDGDPAARELAAEMRQRRAECERIGSVFTRWVVLWGPATRKFWGFPAFNVPPGTMVSARDPGELAALMKAEQLRAEQCRGYGGY